MPTESPNTSNDFNYEDDANINISACNSQTNQNDETSNDSSQQPQIIMETCHQRLYSEEEVKTVIHNYIEYYMYHTLLILNSFFSF